MPATQTQLSTLPELPNHAPALPQADKSLTYHWIRWAAYLLILAAAGWGGGLLLRRPRGTALVVSVSPRVEGDILIDGMPAGAPDTTLHPATGSHTIGFVASGWTARPQAVVVTDGQEERLMLLLVAKPAHRLLQPIYPQPAATLAPPVGDTIPLAQAGGQATICGREIRYDATSVSDNQGLAGLWIGGTWSVRACSGLCIEAITSGGSAHVTYVYATRSAPLAPRMLQGPATIADGTTLKFVDPEGGSFFFSLSDGRLAGRFVDVQGHELTTAFHRQ